MSNVAADIAAKQVAERTGVAHHDVAVVLGSGWTAAQAALDVHVRIPRTQLEGFHAAGVAGHAGTVSSATCGGHRVLLFAGRTHLYEGFGVPAVVHGVRTAAAAGCRSIILTNGSGSLQPQWQPGTPVIIADHINLTGASPLVGPEFVDMTDAYSARLRNLVQALDASLPQGVYAQFPGPQYETPAEVRMAAALGAELVGMSTALEAIAARALGLEVLGLSLVTNAAAGMSAHQIDHEDVLAAGAAAGPRLSKLLTCILEAM